MARKKRDLGNDTYFTVFNSDLKLIKDPVKKILFTKIKNWIYRNEDKESKYHFKAGYWWTFGSYEFWAEECGLETKTVGTHLRELVKSGILKTGNFNKLKIDKTTWYRLATAEEMENVDFKMLYYGKSNVLDMDNQSNNSLLKIYQNGMIDIKNYELHKEDLGSPLPENISEYHKEDILENESEIKLNYISEKKNNVINQNNEEIKILNNVDNIIEHINHLIKLNIEDISTETIKIFFDKFHEKNIDSILDEGQLFTFKCRIDAIYENELNPIQIKFCKDLAMKYYNEIISPQPAKLISNEVTSTLDPSPTVPLATSSQTKVGINILS